MGEKTDKLRTALRGRLNGGTKWAVSLTTLGAALVFAISQGWVAIGWATTAYVSQTFEAKDHAAETYERRADADLWKLRAQAQIDVLEGDHAEWAADVKMLRRDISWLMFKLSIPPPPPLSGDVE